MTLLDTLSARPWAIATLVAMGVFVGSFVVKVVFPAAITATIGTGLLAVAAGIAALTSVGLLVQGRAQSREFIVAVFLFVLSLGQLVQ